MPCFKPVTAWQPDEGGSLVFRAKRDHREIEIPCGQCVGCRGDKATDWGVRITHESKLYDRNAWVTLTYEHSPITLIKSHLPKFIRALRQAQRRAGNKEKIPYFGVGEYGEGGQRPHYHVCLFNYWPDDAKPVKGTESFESEKLQAIWGRGFVDVRHLNWQRALYLGKYSFKKVNGDKAASHYTTLDPETGELIELYPEHARMSLNPAIGFRWYDRYKSDYFPSDHVIIDGRKHRVPLAYLRRFKDTDPVEAEQIIHHRKLRGKQNSANNTAVRLRVREQIAIAKTQLNKRKL